MLNIKICNVQHKKCKSFFLQCQSSSRRNLGTFTHLIEWPCPTSHCRWTRPSRFLGICTMPSSTRSAGHSGLGPRRRLDGELDMRAGVGNGPHLCESDGAQPVTVDGHTPAWSIGNLAPCRPRPRAPARRDPWVHDVGSMENSTCGPALGMAPIMCSVKTVTNERLAEWGTQGSPASSAMRATRSALVRPPT